MNKRLLFGVLALSVLLLYALACKQKGGSRTASSDANISAKVWWNPRGNTIVVSVRIQNTGTETASGIKFHVSSPGSLLPSTLEHGSLAPGKKETVSIQLKARPSRAGTIKVRITGDNFSSVTASVEYKPYG